MSVMHIAEQVAFCDGYRQYWKDGRLVELSHPMLNHVAWCYRCCDNPRTDSWLTVGHPHDDSIERLRPDQQFAVFIPPSGSAIAALHAFHGDKVQKIHERKLAAIAQIEGLVGVKVAAPDLANKSHGVEVIGVDLVDQRMLADDMVWVHYRCCGNHEHVERIHRLWHGADPQKPAPKSDSEVSNEIGQHRINAALHHANKIAAEQLAKANANATL
jgi:hypothetical protein